MIIVATSGTSSGGAAGLTAIDDVDGAAVPVAEAVTVSAIAGPKPQAAASAAIDAPSFGDDDEPPGSEDSLEAGPEDPSPLEPPPAIIADLTAACVRFVQGKYGVPLDFTSDTLSLVDQYVRDARAEIAILPQSLDLLAGSIGAYFGEVCRRTFGGVWIADGPNESYRLCFTRVHLVTNPIGVGREAVLVQPEPRYHGHFAVEIAARGAVEERLRMLPRVEEGEYYLPSTRFDVLSMIVEIARGQMIADGRSAARFTPADYHL
jgi:hypothetical protein